LVKSIGASIAKQFGFNHFLGCEFEVSGAIPGSSASPVP